MGTFDSDISVGNGVLLALTLPALETVTMGANPAAGCGPDESYPMHVVVVPQSTAMDAIDSAQAKGGHHGCRLRKGPAPADIQCWGVNDSGQTGEPASPCAMPHDVAPPLGKFWTTGAQKGITAGGNHTCAITSDQKLWCWGSPDAGAIGDVIGPSEMPQQILSGTWKNIVSGPHHMCGISASNGSTACWGENRFGEVGNGMRFHPEPVTVIGL